MGCNSSRTANNSRLAKCAAIMRLARITSVPFWVGEASDGALESRATARIPELSYFYRKYKWFYRKYKWTPNLICVADGVNENWRLADIPGRPMIIQQEESAPTTRNIQAIAQLW